MIVSCILFFPIQSFVTNLGKKKESFRKEALIYILSFMTYSESQLPITYSQKEQNGSRLFQLFQRLCKVLLLNER